MPVSHRAMVILLAGPAQQVHSLFHIQCRAYPRKRKAQFHQRDGHRRLHPHHHGLGIQNAGHVRYVAQHPADEGIHHVERGNVDQHSAGVHFHNAVREVFLGSELTASLSGGTLTAEVGDPGESS